MVHRHYVLLTSVLSTCVAFAGTGCHQESSPQVQIAPERPTPEESFEAIVEIFKNGMELPGGNVTGFVAQNTNASSRFQVHNTVSSQFLPPAKPDEPYRGTITITSQSIYSLHRMPESDDNREKNDRQDAQPDRGFGRLDDAEDATSGFDSFDRGLVSDSSDHERARRAMVEEAQRRPDKVDRAYDLVYQGGRWELTTMLDPKTEASVENAFQRALRLQP